MPFTQAPTNDTYSTSRVNLYREVALRDGATSGKDEDYLNVFIEQVRQSSLNDDRKFIQKRAGIEAYIASQHAGPVRGMYFWGDLQQIYYCVNTDVYIYNVQTGVLTELANVFVTTTGDVGFCEYLFNTGVVALIATDGTRLVQISTTNVVTTCADANLPNPHVPNPIYLDGYLFLAKTNSAFIYNSVVNDPFNWTGGNNVQAEMEADYVVNIAKVNNYLVVFGSTSIEYFWDAANASPASPLQRNDTPIKINRYLGGLSQYGNTLYYIGQDAGGQPDVFMLKDFKVDSVGSPTISRYLDSAADGIANWTGNIVSSLGHTYYVITAGALKTFVYDVDTKLWTRWAYQQTTTFPISSAIVGTNASNARTYFALQNATDSTIYKFNRDLYQDVGVNFTASVVTEGNDFGTMNRKTMSRLSIIGDRPTSNAYMDITYSDDDQQTYSTSRSVNLNQDLPSLRQLGSFRQRIFKLSFTVNVPMRIQSLEVDINKGRT